MIHPLFMRWEVEARPVRLLAYTFQEGETEEFETFKDSGLEIIKVVRPKIAFEFLPVKEANGFSFADVSSEVDAEDRIIDDILSSDKIYHFRTSVPDDDSGIWDSSTMAMITVNRASTRIATRSRRGCGNVVITNSAFLERLSKSDAYLPLHNEDQAWSAIRTGRCRLVGFIMRSIAVYVDEKASPEQPTIVIYRGHNDPDTAFTLIGKDGDLSLARRDNANLPHVPFTWTDYVAKVSVDFVNQKT